VCLLVLAWEVHPTYRLVVAANRDEFHERPSAPLAEWPEPPGMFAGRDLRAGGTWLGVDRAGRFGVITNYRDLQRPLTGAPSRGGLIPAYLSQQAGPASFLAQVEPAAADYSGFNLLLSDDRSLWYASNRTQPFARALAPGIYGLSNHLLDTPWPKLTRVRSAFETWLSAATGALPDALWKILGDRTPAIGDQGGLTTGLPPQWEAVLSSPFVLNREYGTRNSTLVLLERSGALTVKERRFDPDGSLSGETELGLPRGAPA
jgi:uncharacterized protein with NRDE domain